MRGWIVVNLLLLAMIGFAAGALFLALKSIRALGVSDDLEHGLMAFACVATLVATGYFGKILLATLEKHSRAR